MMDPRPKRDAPITRPLTAPVTLGAPVRDPRSFGRFGGNWERTVWGITPDSFARGAVHLRSACE